jgi:hypothetical protein
VPVIYSLFIGGGLLAGRVTNSATGNPIAGGCMQVVSGATRTTITDDNGRYWIRVPGDTYTVTAAPYGYRPQTQDFVQVEDGGVTTQNFALDRLPTHRLSGTVSRAANGSLVANAEVKVMNTPVDPVYTDANGSYIFPAVAEGTYTIQAGTGCLAPFSRSVTIAGDMDMVDFALTPRVDAFGYSCDDTAAFNWIDGDTLLPLSGDDETMPVTLPFVFSFYGRDYDTIYVSTNGFGNFLEPDASYANVCIPNRAPPNALVAPFWTDLIVMPPAGVYTKLSGEAPNRQFTIEWRDATFFIFSGVVTFEVTLDEATGSLTYQYNRAELFGDGRRATLGMENEAGTVGLQYSCRHQGVVPNKAIKFFRAP